MLSFDDISHAISFESHLNEIFLPSSGQTQPSREHTNWITHESALRLIVRSTDGSYWHDDVQDLSFNAHVYIPLLMKLSIVLKIYKVSKWIKARTAFFLNFFNRFKQVNT